MTDTAHKRHTFHLRVDDNLCDNFQKDMTVNYKVYIHQWSFPHSFCDIVLRGMSYNSCRNHSILQSNHSGTDLLGRLCICCRHKLQDLSLHTLCESGHLQNTAHKDYKSQQTIPHNFSCMYCLGTKRMQYRNRSNSQNNQRCIGRTGM